MTRWSRALLGTAAVLLACSQTSVGATAGNPVGPALTAAARGDVAASYAAYVAATGAAGNAATAAPTGQARAGIAEAAAVKGLLADSADPASIAGELTAFQARTLGVAATAPVVAAHAGPSLAARALLARHAVTPSAAQLAGLQRLDRLAEPGRTALTRVIDAFAAFETATRTAYRTADLDLARAAGGTYADGVRALQRAGVDVGLVLGARDTLLDAAVALRDAAPRLDVATTVNICPVLAVDFAGTPDTYTTDCLLTIDAGGNDTYLNNAGGTRVVDPTPTCGTAPVDLPNAGGAAAAIDLGGDDRYVSGGCSGVNGGGHNGAGFLYDAGNGADVYTASGSLEASTSSGDGTNGGGSLGVGFLLDSGGGDSYTSAGVRGLNGGGSGGVGLLLDAGSGDDSYVTGEVGSNGGGELGLGVLVDAGGNDTYRSQTSWVGGGPGADAANGGGREGAGFLYDASGSDTYTAGEIGTNGGAVTGSGFLFDDGTGTDSYTAGDYGTNGGGAGFGLEVGGAGFLFDAGFGNTTYTAGDFGTNGGGSFGAGFLLDTGGQDHYTAGPSGAAANGVNGGGDGGHGLLVDIDQTQLGDVYLDSQGGSGTDRTVALKGIVGSQLDWTVG